MFLSIYSYLCPRKRIPAKTFQRFVFELNEALAFRLDEPFQLARIREKAYL